MTTTQSWRIWNKRHSMSSLPHSELIVPQAVTLTTVKDDSDERLWDILEHVLVGGQVIAEINDTGEYGNSCSPELEVRIEFWDGSAWRRYPGWTQVGEGEWLHESGAMYWSSYDGDLASELANKYGDM